MAFLLNNLTNSAREQYKVRRISKNLISNEGEDINRFSSFSSISSSFDERLSDAEFVRSFVPPPAISPPPSPPPPPPPSFPPPHNMNIHSGLRRPSRIPPPPARKQPVKNINKIENHIQEEEEESNNPPSQQDILHQSVLSAISGGIKLRHRSIKVENNSPTMQNLFEKQLMGKSSFLEIFPSFIS